jgi:hypothetical protein
MQGDRRRASNERLRHARAALAGVAFLLGVLAAGTAEARPEYGKRCVPCHGIQRPPGPLNVRALHDPASPEYRRRCLACHRDLLRARTLNRRIPDIHRAMIRALRVKAKRSCTFCHHGVDFDHESAGNIRRQVDVEQCAVCHQRGGEAKVLYVR